MRFSILVLTVILGSVSACSLDADIQSLTDQDIDLHILENEKVNFEGTVMSFSDFEDKFKVFELSKNAVVNFKVDKEATMGQVTDIQQLLREKGTLKINYTQVSR